ncbi:MAG: terminase family protein [Clostridia bacterium]|nr:terminase family protein [Clostridia bacterium]
MQILKVEEEQRRRASLPLATYNVGTVHEKQIAFHKCPKRNRWVFGGNRSGKTECGAVESLYMALGIHPYRKNRENAFGWVVSLSQQVQRDVAQKKILHYLDPERIIDVYMLSGRKDSPQNGIIDQIVVRNAFGGESVIGFKSCDQGREKFQGSSLDFVWFDEEPPKEIYEECLMRVLDREGDIFGTMTPLKGLTFLYEEIYLNRHQNPEIWYEFIEWRDNPFLSRKEIELMERSLDESTLDARKFGKFSASEGLVYPEFDESVHVIEPFPIPFEWQDTISIDPGLNNPTSAHWYAIDYDNNVYVVAEHFVAGRDVDFHAERIKETCDRLSWHRDGKGRVEALIDSAASQRTLASAKSVSELFAERGILVDTNVNKDLFSGIARVKSYLRRDNGTPNLYIFSSCVNLIREMKGYFWGSGDRPVKKDDHALDELRYYLMKKPYNVEKEIKSPVQLDKERRYKRLVRQRYE